MTWGKWYVITITALYFAGMFGYEGWALAHPDKHATISEMVWAMIKGHPWLHAGLCITLLVLFSVLMGHFFWQRRS